MKKKTIIFFHPYFGNGGVERTNIRLSRYFLKHNYEVEFLSLFFEGKIVDEAKECGIKLVELKENRTFKSIFTIRKYIKEKKKDSQVAIISCQNYANLVILFALSGIRRDLKLILTERNNPVSLDVYQTGLKDRVIIFLMKCFYRYADEIVAISEELADDLSEMVHAQVKCIYNPTFSEDFDTKSKEKVDEKWFEENIPVILSVGRLERQKDFSTLIKAFARIKMQKNARLIIVGSGSQKEELISLVQELELEGDVKFLPFDANPYKYMARADVFVVSSIYEGLCNTVIEATALKVPCVVTDCKSGPKEILLHGKGGRVVKVGDTVEMADAIIWVLDNPNDANELMQNAYNALNRFTLDEAGKSYLNVIEL